MFSSVIWFQFMKCWKIQQNEKSKWNNIVVVCLGRTFFIVKKLLFCTSRYNKVLKDGLPDWKSALYYYRRYRKMGLAEMIGLVFVIFTIAQYIVSWAVYAEKKYTAVSSYGVTTCQKLNVLSTPHLLHFIIINYSNEWFIQIWFQEEIFGSKLRKLQKKNKSGVNIDEILNQIPTPSIKNTLPFQIVRGVWNTPGAIKEFIYGINEYKEQIREEKRR